MRKSLAFLLLGALVALATPAHAAKSVPRLMRFPTGVVHAGDKIELEWSKPSGEVKELEIMLAVGDDEQFSIRVSPELERYQTHWTWKVPDLSAEHARLCVRYGEEHKEMLSASTPEFRIASRKEAGTAPKLRTAWMLTPAHVPDWWDETDGCPSAPLESALAGVPALSLGALPIACGIAPGRSQHDAAVLLANAVYLPVGEAVCAQAPSSRCFAAVPQYLPLRE